MKGEVFIFNIACNTFKSTEQKKEWRIVIVFKQIVHYPIFRFCIKCGRYSSLWYIMWNLHLLKLNKVLDIVIYNIVGQ